MSIWKDIDLENISLKIIEALLAPENFIKSYCPLCKTRNPSVRDVSSEYGFAVVST